MSDYYTSVGKYFDEDCSNYEHTYWQNNTLQRIRQSFREEVKRLPFHSALEIGVGPGLDLAHFGTIYPYRLFYGIDISDNMVTAARQKVDHLSNVMVEKASIDQLSEVFPDKKFDLIYVFFGALNTVEDFDQAIHVLFEHLNDNGKMVVTFVNKFYVAEILISTLKLNIKKALARFQKIWTGYSSMRVVKSHCYSPKTIKWAIKNHGVILKKRGYSILHPAWYRDHWVKRMGTKKADLLWKVDQLLNGTFLWATGEYTLFVIKKEK